MRGLDADITIHAAPERVWSVLVDLGRYAEWNPFIRTASGEVRVGARLAVRIHPPGGRAMSFRPTVREATPGRELRWVGRLWMPGLFDGEHAFRLEPAGPGLTRFRQSERFRGLLVPLVPSALYERTRQGFEEMNRALKARVEHGSP